MSVSPLKIYLLVFLVLIGKGHAFEVSWENVTYVPVLSESARKDNDFFNEDSFNEISYTITRPVDFENGTLFSRPTYITEVIPPTLTPVALSRVNHTIRRFFQEETPYFYDPTPREPIKSRFLEQNSTKPLEANAEVKEKNKSGVISEKNESSIEMKRNSLKAKPRKKKKIRDQIRQINKKTEFLLKSLQKIRKENLMLKKRLKKADERKKRSFRRPRKRLRKPMAKQKKKAKCTRFRSPTVKKTQEKSKNSGIFEKMRGLARLERLFQ